MITDASTNDIELIGKIGSGASGVVLKAMWKSKNILVAVKKIHVKTAENIHKEVKYLIIFAHYVNLCSSIQVEIMKSVRHKNIVLFHGYYQDPDENHLIILGWFIRKEVYSF